MDWMALAELGVSFLSPLIWAISAWIAIPSIIKLIGKWNEFYNNRKNNRNMDKYDKINQDFSEDLENDKK